MYKLPAKFPLLLRKKNTDKTDYGHTLVLAGSKNMMGAALLTSEAALRSGSGLVTLGLPEGFERLTVRLPKEIMRLSLPATKSGALDTAAYPRIMDFAEKKRITAIAAGPGLSNDPRTFALIRKLVAHLKLPVVLDADGLNAFEGYRELLERSQASLVLTPHAREFERLFRKKLPSARAERIELAKRLSGNYDGVLVLKGHRTLVAADGVVYENTTGNPGMAKGGTGDVLTGVIAAFISQRLSPFLAAVWGVYFHGLAGDLATRQKSELSVAAGDIIDFLPRAFKKYSLE